MAKTTALGDGPIEFSSNGAQMEIPLDAIQFDSNNVVVKSGYTVPADLSKWLGYLASRRRLVPGTVPPTPTAVIVTAAASGSAGNNIDVDVTPTTDPTKVDVTVTATDTYTGLTIGSLNSVLGNTGGGPATQPGLLHVVANPPGAPDPAPTTDHDITATTGAAGTLPSWTIAGSATATPSTAVILEPRAPATGTSVDPANFTVSIKNYQPPAGGGTSGGTFTLIVIWSKKAPNVSANDVQTKLAALGYMVKASQPATGFALPRPGTVGLAGGSEPVDAVAAKADILTND